MLIRIAILPKLKIISCEVSWNAYLYSKVYWRIISTGGHLQEATL